MKQEIEHQGDALNRLTWILDASSILSREFRGEIQAWAYKAVELAYHDGMAKGKEIVNVATTSLKVEAHTYREILREFSAGGRTAEEMVEMAQVAMRAYEKSNTELRSV